MVGSNPVYNASKITTKFSEYKKRHATYDKPSVRHLEAIGVMEFWLSELFNSLFSKPLQEQDQEVWQKQWRMVRAKIDEFCPDNLEKKQSLLYLSNIFDTASAIVEDEKDSAGQNKIQLSWLLICFENTRDWVRKSIIREKDIG